MEEVLKVCFVEAANAQEKLSTQVSSSLQTLAVLLETPAEKRKMLMRYISDHQVLINVGLNLLVWGRGCMNQC